MDDEMYEYYTPYFVWKVFRQDYPSLATDIALGLVITLVIAALCLKKRKARIQDRPLPPGPSGVRVLGYLPFLGSSPHVTYQRLAAKYGPIVRVKLGSEDVVVLNDLDSIKEGLNKDEFLARPTNFLLKRVGIDVRILMGNAQNLFGAGTNTVRATIEWNLLSCARDSEGVQRKLQQEVDNIVGRERAPEWEDRHRMPYTMAFIWEMLRWRTPTPLGPIRMVERDTTICGFHIPAETVVLSNVWAVHHDPELWKHPFDFDPTRFLNEDHTVLLPKPAALMPFSTGRRMCPAETLAIMEIFMYLATLMQKFTVLPKEGEAISMDSHQGLNSIPLHSQELRFLPR